LRHSGAGQNPEKVGRIYRKTGLLKKASIHKVHDVTQSKKNNNRHTSGGWYPDVFLNFIWIPAFTGMTTACFWPIFVIPADAGIQVFF